MKRERIRIYKHKGNWIVTSPKTHPQVMCSLPWAHMKAMWLLDWFRGKTEYESNMDMWEERIKRLEAKKVCDCPYLRSPGTCEVWKDSIFNHRYHHKF